MSRAITVRFITLHGITLDCRSLHFVADEEQKIITIVIDGKKSNT